jgi:hypothetical protein
VSSAGEEIFDSSDESVLDKPASKRPIKPAKLISTSTKRAAYLGKNDFLMTVTWFFVFQNTFFH